MTKLLALVLLVAVALTGCGDSALQTHARIATSLHTVNTTGVEVMEVACRERALSVASDESLTHAEATAAAEAVVVRCERAAGAQHLFADGLDTYVDQLVLEVSGDGEPGFKDRAFSLAFNLIGMWTDFVALMASFDVALPALPSLLTSLAPPR